MEIKIILLNVMKYKDKETKEDRVRIGYVPFGKEALRKEDKFIGFTELGGYTSNVSILDQVKPEDMLQEATLIGEEVQNPRNPFKKTMKLTQLNTKHANISLV